MSLKIIAAAVAALAIAASASAGEYIGNGGFESGFAGFTATGTVAVISGAAYVANAGGSGSAAAQANHFASFGAGNVAGVGLVSQGFATVAGRSYTLSFDYGAFNSTSEQLAYTVTGALPVALPTPAGTSNLDALFTHYTTTFTGSGAPTAIAFQVAAQGGDNADILLDNVSVTAVPEASTWLLFIAGFGLIGVAARRRVAAAA